MSFNYKIINKNIEFLIFHGSENTVFVCILYADYADIWMSAYEQIQKYLQVSLCIIIFTFKSWKGWNKCHINKQYKQGDSIIGTLSLLGFVSVYYSQNIHTYIHIHIIKICNLY